MFYFTGRLNFNNILCCNSMHVHDYTIYVSLKIPTNDQYFAINQPEVPVGHFKSIHLFCTLLKVFKHIVQELKNFKG